MLDLDLAYFADPDLEVGLLADTATWARHTAGWAEHIESWLVQLAAELPPELCAPAYSLGLSLVGDGEIAALNNDWRQQQGPTDVLAFAAQEAGLDDLPPLAIPGPLELGDIVISVETAARQAAQHGHNLEEELLFLASHGLLHLLGWDHPDEAKLAAMLARQEELVKVRPEP